MQIEDVLKWAINSTVGESDFKPLDQIITDSKGLVASNSIYVLLNGYEWGTNQKADVQTLNTAIMNVKGSVRIKASGRNAARSAYLYLNIYKNGTRTARLSWSGETDAVEKIVDIPFSKNDVLTIEGEVTGTGGAGAALTNAQICADVIDLSGITLT